MATSSEPLEPLCPLLADMTDAEVLAYKSRTKPNRYDKTSPDYKTPEQRMAWKLTQTKEQQERGFQNSVRNAAIMRRQKKLLNEG